MTSWGGVVVVNCYCHTSPIGWPQMAGLWGSRWQQWPQLCAMLLVVNIEDIRGLLPSLSLCFICGCFYFPISPVPKHACVLLTHPSRASTQPLVTGDICIFNGNYADCWGWAASIQISMQTEHPEHAATVTRAYSHPFSSHLYSSYLKTQI